LFTQIDAENKADRDAISQRYRKTILAAAQERGPYGGKWVEPENPEDLSMLPADEMVNKVKAFILSSQKDKDMYEQIQKMAKQIYDDEVLRSSKDASGIEEVKRATERFYFYIIIILIHY
jgi:hypothetical protein